jgi:hypothetical protein
VNRHCLVLAAVAAASVVACASVDQQPTSAEARPEKVYNTGSHIPVRDRNSGSADVRSVQGTDIGDVMDKRGVITNGGGGK